MSERTFKVTSPHMKGEDIRLWQQTINARFESWNIELHVEIDGDYGVATRDASATLLYALGISQEQMVKGVTDDLRIKVRNNELDANEKFRFGLRVKYRATLRQKYAVKNKVAAPINFIISSSWGYHPGVHDGVDLICSLKAPIYAICDGQIIRADASGWWGLGAPSDPDVKALGDGIIVLRCMVNVGPFRTGLNFGYGHAEGAMVKEGDMVQAGQHIGHAGFANAAHVHFMVNNNNDARGVGDRDPMPYVNYALKNR